VSFWAFGCFFVGERPFPCREEASPFFIKKRMFSLYIEWGASSLYRGERHPITDLQKESLSPL